MSDRQFERAVLDWLGDGSDRTPPLAIDAVLLAVRTTPQERAPRIPRRFNSMPTSLRLAAAFALVAVVGFGALVYVGTGPGPSPSNPTTTPTVMETPIPTPVPTEVARGIVAWATYTSAVHGTTFGYPSDWPVRVPATRTWQPNDAFPADELRYADTFASSADADAQIGLIVWQMHIDVFTGTADLLALAGKFCAQVAGEVTGFVAASCETFTERAEPLDFTNDNQNGCAILVPTADQQYAFLSGSGCVITEATSWITVVVVAREEDFPSAARYGGSVELLKSVIATMKVSRPGQQPGT